MVDHFKDADIAVENVVEVVRDASGQPADCLQLLRVSETILEIRRVKYLNNIVEQDH